MSPFWPKGSDVSHELSHGLLLHEPRSVIVNGCRDYAKSEEDEATWLAGCLLVPRDAAVVVAMSGAALDDAAAALGVSTQMVSYRVHSTGAKRQAGAVRARRGRGA
jgi:Zn-dependent peptidase ImmA (M78 family)